MGGLTIAVTGAAGMLGSHLVARLAADGHDVVGVDLRDDPHPPAGARHIVADIRDGAALARAFDGAHALVHCAAALPSYPVDQIRSITVDGTRTVLTAAHRARVERVVHISSTAVYGLPKQVPTPEEHPREPVDPYSRAKAEAEEVCEEFRARGMCLPVLRPKTFLGPGRMGLFSMLFEWAEERRNFPVLGRGDVRIQMFGMADLVDAVVLALNAPPETANDVYNLGAAEFGTLREDFQVVLDAAGHGRRVVPLPAAPALAVLRLLERTKLSPVYGRLLFKLLDDSYVDIGRATERLGFRPALSNRDAILGTYAWWRTQRGPAHPLPEPAGPAGTRGAKGRSAWPRSSSDPLEPCRGHHPVLTRARARGGSPARTRTRRPHRPARTHRRRATSDSSGHGHDRNHERDHHHRNHERDRCTGPAQPPPRPPRAPAPRPVGEEPGRRPARPVRHPPLGAAAFLRTGWAVLGFTLASALVYVVNDLADRERDRLHPVKRHRPIASGRVSTLAAVVLTGALALALTGWAVAGPAWQWWPTALYLALSLAYSQGLKHVPLVDAFIVATGFVLRLVQGALLIGAQMSEWLALCVFSLCLMLALGKRRHEMTAAGRAHRPALRGYTLAFLDHLVVLVAVLTAVSYVLYLRDDASLAAGASLVTLLSAPCAVFGLARYLQLLLVEEGGGNPVHVLFRDRATLVNAALWAVLVALALLLPQSPA